MIFVDFVQRDDRGTTWSYPAGDLKQHRSLDTLEPIDSLGKGNIGLPENSAFIDAIDEIRNRVVEYERANE
ncbi:hypothetical protein A5658_26555 [Mycobacterium sp. 1245111.1]|nr:hypothetical protein A5658_26555 [Mycobacterium sp. 1245111.1]